MKIKIYLFIFILCLLSFSRCGGDLTTTGNPVEDYHATFGEVLLNNMCRKLSGEIPSINEISEDNFACLNEFFENPWCLNHTKNYPLGNKLGGGEDNQTSLGQIISLEKYEGLKANWQEGLICIGHFLDFTCGEVKSLLGIPETLDNFPLNLPLENLLKHTSCSQVFEDLLDYGDDFGEGPDPI